MIAAMVCMGGLGLFAGVALGIAAQIFHLDVDPRETEILNALPGFNDGACGYPGCAAYAKAVVTGAAGPDLCHVGGTVTAKRIAEIMGLTPGKGQPPLIAVVFCQGDRLKAKVKYRYLGMVNCGAAQMIAEGPKECPAGCLGMGRCVRACPFDAIEITPEKLAVISRDKCTGCQKCVSACPRSVIRMVPEYVTTHVLCRSHDKGARVRQYCEIGCIACAVCQKVDARAYQIKDNLAQVNDATPPLDSQAITQCPTHCIRDFAMGYPEGSTFTR